MSYRNLRQCVTDLEKHKHLIRIDIEVDPHLEAAAIHRRVFQANGPAIFFTNVKNSKFPMVSNLFGNIARAKFIFRHQLATVEAMVACKAYPEKVLKTPLRWPKVLSGLWNSLPRIVRRAPLLENQTLISKLPQLVCWPKDGGAFVTLPQVHTEDVDSPGWRFSNIGMYRIQLSGNQYKTDEEVGLHYQLHRGIGVHHSKAINKNKPFRVAISVGGPPSLAVAAVMPLPEGMPEICFAGALGGRRMDLVKFPMPSPDIRPILLPAEADFCIVGVVDPNRLLPEGPFGDHLGYYSLAHDFPVMKVEAVYHRTNAIWPFTVVGRPPQEDTAFGDLIHELTGPILPTVIPGIHAVNAVDAAGVHPLLLAIGSERYTPYNALVRPQELLTAANAILGQGQLSLAKFLLIIAKEDNPELDIKDIPLFFRHLLERIDFSNDLHFHTRTTIDTLDYSGSGLNLGSKVVFAAAGPVRRTLPTTIPEKLNLPNGFDAPRVCLPGILAIKSPPFLSPQNQDALYFCDAFNPSDTINQFPMILLVDDSDFASACERNFLWTVFTKTNPAKDIHGIASVINDKHWGCIGSLVIDARSKPHHAPALVENPAVERAVDALGVRGGPLHGII
ncbi:MAG: UbiD family decarboxylase [Planctomycetia bacterium]|nr:UbiD family decarboxylase [Gemmataceae bacterium]NBT60909.1 UbiD family decarboxylase [Planctomycetia bacterium]